MIIASPIGNLEIKIENGFITAVSFTDKKIYDQKDSLSKVIKSQLEEYFTKDRQHFELPLLLKGTEIQKMVWEHLQQIPYGVTTTYKAIAKDLLTPKHVRVVANSIAKNPILILIPCHRIIGSNRSLTGYAGGIERKRLLLELENGCSFQKLF